MNQDHVQTLQEMGFLSLQATEALQASNNDLTRAIAYLFGEVGDNTGAGTEQSPYLVNDSAMQSAQSVPLTNPEAVPEFLGLYPLDVQIESPAESDSEMNPDTNTFEVTHHDTVSMVAGLDSDSMMLTDEPAGLPPNVKDGQQVPVLITQKAHLKPWVPLLSVMCSNSHFAKAVLESPETLPFATEMKNLCYFVQNFRESKRWYYVIDVLADEISAAQFTNSANDEELPLAVIEHLMQQIPETKAVFESMVESCDEDFTKELTVLEIEPDSRAPTLYESLNELFWLKNFESLGDIKYKHVAPIVVYQLVSEHSLSEAPFRLEPTIYPEIYSEKAIDAIRRELLEMTDAKAQYRTLCQKLMDLNFFEGKKVEALLKHASNAMSAANSGASEDLDRLLLLLQRLREAEQRLQGEHRERGLGAGLRLYRLVIAEVPGLRRYDLVGVLLAGLQHYVFRDGSWHDSTDGSTVAYDHVQEHVTRYLDKRHITLVYGAHEAVAAPSPSANLEAGAPAGSQLTPGTCPENSERAGEALCSVQRSEREKDVGEALRSGASPGSPPTETGDRPRGHKDTLGSENNSGTTLAPPAANQVESPTRSRGPCVQLLSCASPQVLIEVPISVLRGFLQDELAPSG